jgi:hypothetical protein
MRRPSQPYFFSGTRAFLAAKYFLRKVLGPTNFSQSCNGAMVPHLAAGMHTTASRICEFMPPCRCPWWVCVRFDHYVLTRAKP